MLSGGGGSPQVSSLSDDISESYIAYGGSSSSQPPRTNKGLDGDQRMSENLVEGHSQVSVHLYGLSRIAQT